MDNQYMTTGDAAKCIGVNTSRICQLLRAGTLSGVKFGKKTWAISQGDVMSYVAKKVLKATVDKRWARKTTDAS